MSNVVDLLEVRQNMSFPRFAPRRLDASIEAMPCIVADELAQTYIGIYRAGTAWIAKDRNGFVFTVDVIQTGPGLYDYTALLAEPVKTDGPRAA